MTADHLADQQILEFMYWALTGFGTALIAFLGIWWKVESGQNTKIQKLQDMNSHQHEMIHGKIDKVRDKVEEIWKHLVKRNGGKSL
jgi:hypothetical protein